MTYVHALQSNLAHHDNTIDPFTLAADDLDILTKSMLECVAVAQHPVLNHAASYFLDIQGKRVRPVIVVLMGRATSYATTTKSVEQSSPLLPLQEPASPSGLGSSLLQGLGSLLPSQLKLAEITEMIHTASLLHDDVIDVSDKRRGMGSVNSIFGNQLAVLAGDFLLARASVSLARLRDCDVVELVSNVIEHLVRGEVIQMKDDRGIGGNNNNGSDMGVGGGWLWKGSLRSVGELFENYMAKTFYKTASLMANSCRAATMLAGHAARVADAAYDYGKHVGIAFQLIDDVLDMTASTSILGKPALNDLEQGLVTAPVIYALEQFPELQYAIDRKFEGSGDVESAVKCVRDARGIEKTRELARQHAEKAVLALEQALPPSEYRSALVNMVDRVLLRQK